MQNDDDVDCYVGVAAWLDVEDGDDVVVEDADSSGHGAPADSR